MGLAAQELVSVLDQLTTLLQSHGEQDWSAWLAADRARIQGADLYGIEHLLSAYGGMGSLNDLVLCPENGHLIREEQVQRVNDRLRSLKSRAYTLAVEIQRASS